MVTHFYGFFKQKNKQWILRYQLIYGNTLFGESQVFIILRKTLPTKLIVIYPILMLNILPNFSHAFLFVISIPFFERTECYMFAASCTEDYLSVVLNGSMKLISFYSRVSLGGDGVFLWKMIIPSKIAKFAVLLKELLS